MSKQFNRPSFMLLAMVKQGEPSIHKPLYHSHFNGCAIKIALNIVTVQFVAKQTVKY